MTETREARASWLHARFAPTSFDAEARTVEVVWSTGAAVRRRDWEGDYLEELDMGASAVDMSRLAAGAPVLAAHDAYSLESVLGVVERAWLENGEGRALLRFSERAEVQPILADIRAGILRNISVGYDVMEWKEGKTKEGMRFRRAVRWQPAEISLVPIPADASAQVRAAETLSSDGANTLNQEGLMAENAPQAPEVSAPQINAAEVAQQARAAERVRVGEIRSIAQLAARSMLPAEEVAPLEAEAISADMEPAAFRAKLFDAAAQKTEAQRMPAPRPIQMGASGDDPTALADAMADAIAVRAMPGYKPKTERYREFAGLRPSEMLMELSNARGERVSPRDRLRLIERSFHSTSDFPLLLSLSGNKMLEAGFALASPSYRQFFGRKSFNDFKAHSFLQAGDFPAPAPLEEGGEITQGTISEKREQIIPRTYARSVSVTRQMLVNDDLGAFTDFGAMIGRRVADYENALAYAIVNTASGAGPTITEGNAAVFTTGRGNRPASGGAISEANLDVGVAAIAEQTSLDGLKLNLQPRFLLTGSAYRGAALRYTTRISPESGANVGLYSDLTPIMDSNIPGNRWYLFADPAAAPVYVYGYVNGAEAPTVRVHDMIPGRDGISVEVIHDFAVGAIGFRGAFFNPGA